MASDSNFENQKASLVGLCLLTGASLLLVGGEALIWVAGWFWQYESLVFGSNSHEEGNKLFEAYAYEKSELEASQSELRKQYRRKIQDANDAKDPQAFRLSGELGMLEQFWEIERKGLVTKYGETFNKNRSEAQQIALNRQGWMLSIFFFVFAVAAAGTLAWIGLRLMHRAGLPGTVFERKS